jgi:FkbM family methyltransferase
MNTNLIFDFGFHNGDDTDFYLKKGFKVIAIEANPHLVSEGANRFKNIEELHLLNKAIHKEPGIVDFYIHPNKSDWGSCLIEVAESDNSKSQRIEVEATTLEALCQEYGSPHYLKVDVEGCDTLVAEQLASLEMKPSFVSFEISKKNYTGIFSWLHVAGYTKFQFVNQLNNPKRTIQSNTTQKEGFEIEYQFSKFSSGLFGKDLPQDNWLSFDDALTSYIKYKELKYIDNQELAVGWLDLHASF